MLVPARVPGLLALLLAALALAPLHAQADEKLYFFTESYPPYNLAFNGKTFAHNEDEIGGICTELVQAMMANTKLDYMIKMRDWSYAYNWVQQKANHALYCTARTEQREDSFQWVGPLAPINWTLFAAPDSDISLETLEDARNLRIGGYKGDVMSDYLLERGFNVITGVSGDQNPRRLVLGQIDLWVTDGLVGPLVAAEKEDITGLKPVLTFNSTPMYLAVSKGTDPTVVAKLQAGLEKARSAGQVAKIMQKHGL